VVGRTPLCGVPNFRDSARPSITKPCNCSLSAASVSLRATRPPLHQRGPDSERSCRLASSQSESASPGRANRRRRSEMKYARIRICSSNGSAVCPASGGIKSFAFAAVEPFWRVGPPVVRLVDAPRSAFFLIFIPEGDPPASGGPPVLAWTILLFLGTD